MSDVVVVKGGDGKLSGFGDKGGRAWNRFRAMVDRMTVGETLAFSFWEPRSPQFHKRFFAKLHRLFDMQEQFDDVDTLRAWMTVGAGECSFVPGPKGRMVALPKSIKWHRMDDAEFGELVSRIDTFMWTPHARAFLWPHLSDAESAQMVQAWHDEFSQ